MKTIILCVCLFWVNVLAGAAPIPLHQVSSGQSPLVGRILQGVHTIHIPGVPGDLIVYGNRADVVAASKTDIPLVAVARYGRGTAVAFTHPGYLHKSLYGNPQTIRLIHNLAQLGRRGRNSRILCVRELHLSRLLGKSYSRVGFSREFPDTLSGYDVLFFRVPNNRDPRFRDFHIRSLQRFVRGGGTIIAYGSGWIFQSYGEGRFGKTLDEYYANILFKPMGIRWGSAYGSWGQKRLNLRNSIGNATHLKVQINSILKLINRDSVAAQLSKEALKKQSSFLTRFRNQLVALQDLKLVLSGEQIRAIMKPFIDDPGFLRPSLRTPVLARQQGRRYRMVLAQVIMRRIPRYRRILRGLAADFPGEPGRTDTVLKRITVNTGQKGWVSTGLYAPPGARISVLSSDDLKGTRLDLQIGCHADRIYHKKKWTRWPEIMTRTGIVSRITKDSNPFGGLVYISLHGQKRAKRIRLTIIGAIPAPYFELGKTSLAEWRKMLKTTRAPWGEINSGLLIISEPVSSLRKLPDPRRILRFWNRVIRAQDSLHQPRGLPRPERFVCDREISAGYMHAGYPIMTYMDVKDFVLGLQKGKLYKKGSWGHFHELGHHRQRRAWTFSGTGEVTVNLFTVIALETVLGPSFRIEKCIAHDYRAGKKYLDSGAPFSRWKQHPGIGIVMYMQLRRAFGWDAYRKVFAWYRRYGQHLHKASDQKRMDAWMVRFSHTVGRNLGPFFRMWRMPVSRKAVDGIRRYPSWMPPKIQ